MEKKWKVRKIPIMLFFACVVLVCVSFIMVKGEDKKAKVKKAYEEGFARLMERLPKDAKEKAFKDLSDLKSFKERKVVWYDGIEPPDKILAAVAPEDVTLGPNLIYDDDGVLLIKAEEMTEEWAGLLLTYGLVRAHLDEVGGVEMNEETAAKLADIGDAKFFSMSNVLVNHISNGRLYKDIEALTREFGLHSVQDVADLALHEPEKLDQIVARLDMVFNGKEALSPGEKNLRDTFYFYAVCFYIVDKNTPDPALRDLEYVSAIQTINSTANEIVEKFKSQAST